MSYSVYLTNNCLYMLISLSSEGPSTSTSPRTSMKCSTSPFKTPTDVVFSMEQTSSMSRSLRFWKFSSFRFAELFFPEERFDLLTDFFQLQVSCYELEIAQTRYFSFSGSQPFLHLPNLQLHCVVHGRVLAVRYLYRDWVCHISVVGCFRNS